MNPANTKFSIEPLATNHNREEFSCRNEQLDRYFRVTASQDKIRNIAVTYVVINRENSQIIGYYTLYIYDNLIVFTRLKQ